MPNLIPQPTKAPTRKLAAAGIGGAVALPATQLLVVGLAHWGVQIEPETAAALATVLAWLSSMISGYMTRERAAK